MASRLDLHEEFIVRELLAGRSYTRIAMELVNIGCQTTRVNLMKWAKTRAKKLIARQQLVNPQLTFAPIAPIAPSMTMPAAAVPAAPVSRAPVLAPAAQKQSDRDEQIQIEIVRDERGQVILPPAVGHRPSHTGAPVKSDIAKVIEALQKEQEDKTGFVYTPAMAKLGAKSGA